MQIFVKARDDKDDFGTHIFLRGKNKFNNNTRENLVEFHETYHSKTVAFKGKIG